MTEAEFWVSNMYLVNVYRFAYAKRRWHRQQEQAQQTAAIVKCWSKRKVKPKNLIGPEPRWE